MGLDKNQQTFFALVKAGLWEEDVQLAALGVTDFNEVYRIAEEQSVIGLVAAGIDHVVDVKVPKEYVLQFVGQTLQLEQRNKAMNDFIACLAERMRRAGIYSLLVKGQGVAQCYERPLWRACGDVDFLLSLSNYGKAIILLTPKASTVGKEDSKRKHLGMTIDSWSVELHGDLPFVLSSRVDRIIKEVQDDVFINGNVKSWMNGSTQVFIPAPNNDVLFVFTHFLHHFFVEGVGLRQICDWCRILWKNKENINISLLEKRLKEAGLMSEWRTFAALAVNTLGMPVDAMPFYKEGYTRRSNLALQHILKCGNFGHNNDVSYRGRYSGFLANFITFYRRLRDFIKFSFIFPLDSPKFFVTYVAARMKGVAD